MTSRLPGVGVEMVSRRTGVGDEGEPHAAVKSAAVTTPTTIRIVGMDLIITQR
jgi:hypothetical protein